MAKGKEERLKKVNSLIFTIASHGHRHFWAPGRCGLARFSLDDSGRVWWHDHVTGKRVYTHRPWLSWQRGFTGGGTLNQLVTRLSKFIVHGEPLHPGYFDYRRDYWGYGEGMKAVYDAAVSLGVASAICSEGEDS